jgi:signal transduction histidine kinase
MVPAGIALHARLADALEDRARQDLALAPRVLQDRTAALNDALMMRAKDFAHVAALAPAVLIGDRSAIDRIANDQRPSVPAGIPVVIGADGNLITGPLSDSATVAETRSGKMPVTVLDHSGEVHTLALAPIELNGRWLGAAGFAIPATDDAARTLASLTRSEVIIVARASGRAVASTVDSAMTRAILTSLAARTSANVEGEAAHERVAVATASMGPGADIVFARILRNELAVLPTLRRIALVSGAAALALALAFGLILAHQIGRPVTRLALTADALGKGDFEAPIPNSRFAELRTVSETFGDMRQALAARLADLQSANRELADRAARLTSLQHDLMQRERLAASAQLVGQLAHEIRNPVATLRNLLEVIQRRVADDAETREYAALAIDELLRMHELAERMLDLNRPRDPSLQTADVGHVVGEVATLVTAGDGGDNSVNGHIIVSVKVPVEAAIAPDALKQVLLNLVQNAREAVALGRPDRRAEIHINVRRTSDRAILTVSDNGPGIPAALLPRIFDPFFTTKGNVQGVGLGLFVAEGMVRAAGGRLTARNGSTGGAEFLIELPLASMPATAHSGRA